MRDADSTYHDVELLDLADEGWATLDGDGATVRYHKTRHEAETYSRGYRVGYGRRASDGGPLEWPPVERQFRDGPWEG